MDVPFDIEAAAVAVIDSLGFETGGPIQKAITEAILAERMNGEKLAEKARALLDSVSHDDSGSMVAGQWVGGNGGLLSRATLEAAQVLRLELDNWPR